MDENKKILEVNKDLVKIKNVYKYSKDHEPRDIVKYMCSLADADIPSKLIVKNKSSRINANFEQRNYTKKESFRQR